MNNKLLLSLMVALSLICASFAFAAPDMKEGSTKGSCTITYKGNTYEGVMNMTFPNQGGGEGKMASHMSGKWIDKCK